MPHRQVWSKTADNAELALLSCAPLSTSYLRLEKGENTALWYRRRANASALQRKSCFTMGEVERGGLMLLGDAGWHRGRRARQECLGGPWQGAVQAGKLHLQVREMALGQYSHCSRLSRMETRRANRAVGATERRGGRQVVGRGWGEVGRDCGVLKVSREAHGLGNVRHWLSLKETRSVNT